MIDQLTVEMKPEDRVLKRYRVRADATFQADNFQEAHRRLGKYLIAVGSGEVPVGFFDEGSLNVEACRQRKLR